MYKRLEQSFTELVQAVWYIQENKPRFRLGFLQLLLAVSLTIMVVTASVLVPFMMLW